MPKFFQTTPAKLAKNFTKHPKLFYNGKFILLGFFVMHLILPHETLLKLVDFVAKVADKNHRYQILANICFKLSQDTLILTATNLELELSAKLNLPSGACLEVGETTVIASKFHEICKSLASGLPVEIRATADSCLIVSGKSKFTLPTLPAQDFPSIGTPTNPETILMHNSDLFELINKTRFAIAIQEVRHYLTGLLLQIENAQVTSVATDGHRMAVAFRTVHPADSAFYENAQPRTHQLIVPNKSVAELEKLLNEHKKQTPEPIGVALRTDEEFLSVSLNFGDLDDHKIPSGDLEVTLTTRLIDAKFPDYRRVLPTDTNRTAIFAKDEIMTVLKRVAILSDESLRGVVINFDNSDTATVRSYNTDKGLEATETLPVNFMGEPIEVSFNDIYLKAVFNVLNGAISLQMSHPSQPTLIKQVGDERHLFVVMPMRV